MKTARQTEREAKQLFRFCVLAGSLDENRVRLVVQGVLQSKRRGYLLLLEHFARLLRYEYERHTAEVESAIPLPADLRKRVEGRLVDVYGAGLVSVFHHTPELIGGLRVKVGSDVYDGSIRFRLAALARRFGISDSNGRHIQSWSN